ncbi:MAG TPA: hypothetical protein VFW14_09130 [Gaiellales bacterium]|nr:hypothetical protein [Gaiellales bacterium]
MDVDVDAFGEAERKSRLDARSEESTEPPPDEAGMVAVGGRRGEGRSPARRPQPARAHG